MRDINTIVIHTAASVRHLCPRCGDLRRAYEICPLEGCGRTVAHIPVDSTVEDIDRYHRIERGFNLIGYHEYIRFNGDVFMGRPIWMEGAGVIGYNKSTYHICMSGHGDYADFTELQYTALLERVHAFRAKISPVQIVGHRELLQSGSPNYKSCPGKLIDLDKLRKFLLPL